MQMQQSNRQDGARALGRSVVGSEYNECVEGRWGAREVNARGVRLAVSVLWSGISWMRVDKS